MQREFDFNKSNKRNYGMQPISRPITDWMSHHYIEEVFKSKTPQEVRDWYNKYHKQGYEENIRKGNTNFYFSILSIFEKIKPEDVGERHYEKFKAFYEEHKKLEKLVAFLQN